MEILSNSVDVKAKDLTVGPAMNRSSNLPGPLVLWDVVHAEINKKIENDHIIAQVPSPGTMISRGACVDLLISMGAQPKAFKMPELIGLTLEDALQSIEKVKLVIGEIKSSHYPNKPRNIIVKQTPTSGHRVIAASPVSLLINRDSRKERAGQPYGRHTASLFSYRLDNGFLKRRIRITRGLSGRNRLHRRRNRQRSLCGLLSSPGRRPVLGVEKLLDVLEITTVIGPLAQLGIATFSGYSVPVQYEGIA